MELRHRLYSDQVRLPVSGGRHGLAQPPHPRLQAFHHNGCRVLHGSPGGGLGKFGPPEIFNTDRGAQFTSDAFIGILEAHGIAISMDGKGRAFDNIFIERFWRNVKYEWLKLHSYDNIRELRAELKEYIDFCNFKRIHESLGYKTPEEVYSMSA